MKFVRRQDRNSAHANPIQGQRSPARQGFPGRIGRIIRGDVAGCLLQPAGQIIDTDACGFAAGTMHVEPIKANQLETAIAKLELVSGGERVSPTGAHEQMKGNIQPATFYGNTAIFSEGIFLRGVVPAWNERVIFNFQSVSTRRVAAECNSQDARIGIEGICG
jgi:hypothetical protein